MSEPAAVPPRKPMPRLVVGGERIPESGKEPPAPSAPPVRSSDPVAVFIELEIEARQCADLDSLRLAIVNSTRKLAEFDQAFLLEPSQAGGASGDDWTLTRAASVSKLDRHAPQIRAITAWLRVAATQEGVDSAKPRMANLAEEGARHGLDMTAIGARHAFWLPIKRRDGGVLAVLLALKKEPWKPQAAPMLLPLAGAYGHAWDALLPKSHDAARKVVGFASKRRLALAAALACAVAAFVPVPMSSLAPAEVVAREPVLVTAPIEGVIEEIMEPPGKMVERGTPILKLVDVKLRNDYEIAKRNKAVAAARHFRFVQSATSTQKDLQELAIAKAELDVASAELAYAEDMLSRTRVLAAASGLLIYSAKSEWVGRPVAVGERIMEIGDPQRTEIRIDLGVADALTIRQGGKVALFLDGDPLTSVEGTITRANYRPVPNSDGQLVYRIHAAFSDGVARRIGLRGVARVSADDVPLWFYLFRRPIAAIRQRLGL